MARRSSNAGGGGVSLFPFLSILTCLIGMLTLMIKVISDLKELERGKNQEETARALEHKTLREEIEKRLEERDAVEKQLDTRGAAIVELRDLENRRVVLRKQLDANAAADAEQTDAELQKRVENLRTQIAELRRERPKLDATIAQLTRELEARKIDANAKPPPVVVRPRGKTRARDHHLFFVECNAEGLVLRRDKGEKVSVSTAAILTEPAYAAFLSEAKSDRRALVIFLLRPDGNDTYLRAAGWAEHQFGLRTAKLPIPNQGDIDLSVFSR